MTYVNNEQRLEINEILTYDLLGTSMPWRVVLSKEISNEVLWQHKTFLARRLKLWHTYSGNYRRAYTLAEHRWSNHSSMLRTTSADQILDWSNSRQLGYSSFLEVCHINQCIQYGPWFLLQKDLFQNSFFQKNRHFFLNEFCGYILKWVHTHLFTFAVDFRLAYLFKMPSKCRDVMKCTLLNNVDLRTNNMWKMK